ncbi:C2H2 zinc finger transcription factor [Lithospermum erythrorhizon]|uniref:C2H2 zinc finger transcription factor n=1 Tax=Lithospermum erythrorhizon TaxID=34254 RepID=A0AAV3QJX0_LITER
MDNSSASPGGLEDQVGGFGYTIGVSVGVLFLITTITLASYYCARNQRPSTTPPQLDHHHQFTSQDFVVELGIDEETIKNYPKFLYSEAKKVNFKNSTTIITCCSICLGDYKNSDVLRGLPDCGHLFHAKCIDPWLRMHPTCPLCRTSPLPTPLSTPLAEVLPLATR